MELPMPFEGDVAKARAVWAANPGYNPMVVNPPCPDYTYVSAAVNTVARPDGARLGGITPEILPMPYYQPGSQSIRQPQINGDEAYRSAAVIDHGPSLFEYTWSDVRPAPQYAPEGDSLVDPIVYDVTNEPCGCMCVVPGSMGELFCCAYNVCKIRQMLVETGLVQLTPALAALNYKNACPCQIAGGRGGFYLIVCATAWQYMDTPVITQLTPMTQVNYLNTVYISRVLASLREQVRLNTINNYGLSEGPRAYLQPYTALEYRGGECGSEDLPEVLPGTGCEVFAEDSYATTYALTNPAASRRNVEDLADLMGMPIGDYTPPKCVNSIWAK